MESRKSIDLVEVNRKLDRILARQKERAKESLLSTKLIILTKDEIKEWLAQELGFPKPIRRRLTAKSSDGDLTEPAKRFCPI